MTTAYSERTEMAAATGELDLEDRRALRRVAGLSTELTDITEVEYRALRLERVVLIGVWSDGPLTSAGRPRGRWCSTPSPSGAAGSTRPPMSARARPRNWPGSWRRPKPTRSSA